MPKTLPTPVASSSSVAIPVASSSSVVVPVDAGAMMAIAGTTPTPLEELRNKITIATTEIAVEALAATSSALENTAEVATMAVGSILPALPVVATSGDVSFVAIGDLHTGATGCGRFGGVLPAIKAEKASHLLLCGDLTGGGSIEEYNNFVKTWITEMPKQVLMCRGNHDGDSKELIKLIKARHGDLFYSVNVGDLHIICCDIYPRTILPFSVFSKLKKDLKKVSATTPVVIFNHYNLAGPFSQWWGVTPCAGCVFASPKTEKDKLFDLLKNYNVVGIFEGHWHATLQSLWREKIPMYLCSSGGEYIVARWNSAMKTLNVVFKDGAGKETPASQRHANLVEAE